MVIVYFEKDYDNNNNNNNTLFAIISKTTSKPYKTHGERVDTVSRSPVDTVMLQINCF